MVNFLGSVTIKFEEGEQRTGASDDNWIDIVSYAYRSSNLISIVHIFTSYFICENAVEFS